MASKYPGIVAIAAGFLLPVSALAASITTVSTSTTSFSDSNAIIQQLQTQEQRDEYKAQFWSQEPITQQDYYVQARQDRQLIRRLSAGEPVSADQVEQALRHIDTDY
jgi:hypothetical protein